MLGKRLGVGFLIGVLSVLTFHQITVFLLGATGAITPPPTVYSMAPLARAFGLPTIVNQCFWGGMWGVLFAFLWEKGRFGEPWWAFGLGVGLLGPALIGNMIVNPWRFGQPLFFGGNIQRIGVTCAIGGAFGFGFAFLLPYVSRFLKVPFRS